MSPRFARSLPHFNHAPGRVLICEDADELRSLLVSYLAKQPGLEIVGEVADGRSALDAIAQLQPDALLMDLVMDDTDPDEMLEALTDIEPRPLVIVFSGLTPGALSGASRRIVDVFLDKTTPLRAVAEIVAESIAARRTGERL
jgi:two-component system, LytTR family, response regulator AlgR